MPSSFRNARPVTFQPKGLSDAIDGTNSFPGAMSQLANLVPSPSTAKMFVPRPAAALETDFTGSGITAPAGGTGLLVVGTRVYGMISSSSFPGKDEPFCYDISTNSFVTISGKSSANLPATQPTTGDWQPPHMEMIANRVIVTHPGFAGGVSPYFGWIDVRNFTSASLTGNTHNGTGTIDSLSSNPIESGWEVGDAVTGTNIQSGSLITSLSTGSVTISKTATADGTGVALSVSGGTFAAPIWGAGNTNGNPLVAVPAWVSQFNGRAWYAVGNAEVFSDSLNPLQVTNATQVLTLGDSTSINVSIGLPLNNIQTGGIVQSLIAFKGDAIMYQITGDQATSSLAVNALNVSVGTLAPNTVCPTPLGVAFVAPDGLRIIDFGAHVSDPLGANGAGVSVPLINALTPSRMCAAFNRNVLRISCQNALTVGQPVQEFWLDFNLKIWTGPHTFPAQQIQPYQAASGADTGHGFASFGYGIDGKLWLSGVSPVPSDIYIENGQQLFWTFETVLLPDNQDMSQNRMGQTAVGMALPGGQVVTFSFVNEVGLTLNQVSVTSPMASGSIWGSFTWGSGTWGAPIAQFQQYQLPWTGPIIFKQGAILAVGQSQADFAIGNLYMRYQPLGYLLNVQGAA